MFTTRGYRQTKRENRNKSRQGQIIQQKPVFQIDNNPYVLEQYRKFLFGSQSSHAPLPDLLVPTLESNESVVTLADYSLSWTTSEDLGTIYNRLNAFTNTVFTQISSQGKYPVSLELYSPGDDGNGWRLANDNPTSATVVIPFSMIIIDRLGNLTFKQNWSYSDTLLMTSAAVEKNRVNLTLGYGPMNTVTTVTLGNPTAMRISVNYFTFYNSN